MALRDKLASLVEPYLEPDEGNRFLAVRALITNVSNTPMDKAKDNVLVRKLNGLETAGSLSLLFSDKTGTITEGRLSVA